MKKLLFCFLFSLPLSISWAEDIELYVGNSTQRAGEKPQVLIIFDTSGSMTTHETIRDDYDPNTVYGDDGYVYYSTNSSIPNIGNSRRFLATDNGCASSFSVLANNGFYNGKVKYYRPAFISNNGRFRSAEWKTLSRNGASSALGHYIDCEDDAIQGNTVNAVGVVAGLPSDDTTNLENPPPYAMTPDTFPSFGDGVTLYSSNYVNWYHNSSDVTKSRLAIAKTTVTDLIESAPGVSFGLEVFNQNNSSSTNGGRIAHGIKDDNAALVTIIDDKVSASGNTPLCESLYEAALYFGGKTIKYGDSGGSKQPEKDSTVSTNSVYNSPYRGCSNEVFVILITDGQPTQDTSADSSVNALISGGSGNRLDELAEWMHTNDINPDLPGTQIATIFTIGFSEGADAAGVLLNDAANKGGGKYYKASNPGDLLASLQSALLEILKVSTSFTAPSIASNNFDRTETLDSVYYAMFLPDNGPRWRGNLKKLKVVGDNQLDRTDTNAIDGTGNISDSAKTFWSTSADADGADVTAGGVAEMLMTKTSRSLYSDIGSNGALIDFSYANAVNSFGGANELATFMNVAVDELESYFIWASGIDVDDQNEDGNSNDIRDDIFGDPLHSKPLVVNYGGSRTEQDIRIIVGTNAGFIHMFDDNGNTVDESWAFIPNELYGNLPILRENSSNNDKVYGIDGTPTVHIVDKNGDGSINGSDTAWLYFGLRRGGSAYYAIDISSPNEPKFMWRIDQNTPGFEELGQSWGEVKIGYSKINITDGVAKPVVFLSGGYDTKKDASGAGGADSKGRGVYIVDAEFGDLKWSAAKVSTSGKNLTWSQLSDSIPASLATMDSDSDGLVDRLYTGDTGGNLWRIDMPGNDPTSSETPWTIHQIASLGGDNNANDRRFFNEPSIVRAIITDTVSTTIEVEGGTSETTVSRHERKYDAILIGSGDRSTPTATDTNDMFFMVKDPNIITRSMIFSDTRPLPELIEVDSLYDFTNNPYGSINSTQEKEILDIAVSNASGWKVKYSSGERSVAPATAIAGVAYFTSFSPNSSQSVSQCDLSAGVGKLYAIDLATGSNIYTWRNIEIGDRVPDTPTIVIPPEPPTEDTNEDGIIDENDQSDTGRLRFVGVGRGVDADGNSGKGTITLCDAADCDPVEGIQLETMRTHLYVTEGN